MARVRTAVGLELLAQDSGEQNVMMETGETGMTEAPHGETEIVTMNEGVGIQDETNETGEKKGIIGETTVGGIVTVIATEGEGMTIETGTRDQGLVLQEGTGRETIHDIKSDGDLGVGLWTTRGKKSGDEWLLHKTVTSLRHCPIAWISFLLPILA